MAKVSITNLGSYKERISREPQPTDTFSMTITRAEIEYVSNFVKQRVKACHQAIIDPNVSEAKLRQRTNEAKVVEALQKHLNNIKPI